MLNKQLLISYLQSLLAREETRLPLAEEASPILRKWWIQAERGLQPTAAQSAPAPARAPLAAEDEDAVRTFLAMSDAAINDTPEPVAQDDEEEDRAYFRPGGNTPEEMWHRAVELLPRWEPLQKLKTLRSIPVWGQGSRTADIMLIGDAPGYRDEQEARPFSAETGAKLDAMLKAMGLSREQVYTTHFVKYRPAMPRQTTNTRPPSKEELRLSAPIVEFETRLVRPKVIVALGVIAARGLLERGDLPLAAYQQIEQPLYCGIPVVITHHPSYLLRTSDLAERRRLWEDMLRVMELAHLPISDTQRRYFLPKK